MPVIMFSTARTVKRIKKRNRKRYPVEMFSRMFPMVHQSTPPEIDMNSDSIVIEIDPRYVLTSSERPPSPNTMCSTTPCAITTPNTKITSRRMSTAHTKGTMDLTMASVMRRRLRISGTIRRKLKTRKERTMPVMRITRMKLRSTRIPTSPSSATVDIVRTKSNTFHPASSPTKNSPSRARIRKQISSTKVVVKKSSAPSTQGCSTLIIRFHAPMSLSVGDKELALSSRAACRVTSITKPMYAALRIITETMNPRKY
mmetsp:Transcript_44581/g.118335  ORF Transcript_44581/g.118335 Transcript_44581/m.118335 type:complete len:257 (+) Transcript_44581:575-1345(+)